LCGKPLIDEKTIPRFEYRLDNRRQGWDDLKVKVQQFDSLPSSAQLEAELPDIRDVSSLLEVLQTTANMLALVGGESSDSLSKKIKSLKIIPAAPKSPKRRHEKPSLPKALDNFKLGHLELLVIKLRYVRAKRMICVNQTPFHQVSILPIFFYLSNVRRNLDHFIYIKLFALYVKWSSFSVNLL
jgi:hypothetical protein